MFECTVMGGFKYAAGKALFGCAVFSGVVVLLIIGFIPYYIWDQRK